MAEAVARPKTSGPSGSGPTESGPGKVQRLVEFYHGVMAEMKRVTWPDLPQVRSATIAIIIFVLLLGLFITLLDFALQGVFIKWIPALFSGR
jgi:preprotein translocase subunit SecE